MQKGIFHVILCFFCLTAVAQKPAPRIVNIVNFIRLIEPRDSLITEDVLYQTVVRQIALMRQYHLRGAFLLQYDALMDSRYQELLRSLPRDSFEIGAWWEIPQPLVEKAGMTWRGKYPWDWRANIGFSTGYTPAEREKLADVYMHDFRSVFGYYPKSVASWFIDAHTLSYMYDHYGIVASANCKDQYGTDGYTLWGGYWNQAYYPSKVNAYMPAQHEEAQIPVPIFRMLGSDPVRQYDNGLGSTRQGVVTLEPVYAFGGGDSTWVNWYFEELINGESMAFAYTQVGQENSFTWPAMAKGLQYQFDLISKMRDARQLLVETLGESGSWFKAHYKVTPATSVTVSTDLPGSDKNTVWFNNRFFRVNLFWAGDTLRIRDIHIFNERLPSPYLKDPLTSTAAAFFTLPFVDGYLWSGKNILSGVRFRVVLNGQSVPMAGGTPVVTSPKTGYLRVEWPLTNVKGRMVFEFEEQRMKITFLGDPNISWFADLVTSPGAALPFTSIQSHKISASFNGFLYSISATQGHFSTPVGAQAFRLTPDQGTMQMVFSQ